MNYQKMIQTDGKYDAKKDIYSTVSSHGDEYYTLPEHVQNIIDNLTLPKGSLIWCPFDKEESQFNILLQKAGYYVRRGHIAEGKDFFECPPHCSVMPSYQTHHFLGKRKSLQESTTSVFSSLLSSL